MIFELRQYRMLPGKRDEWIAYMDQVVIPSQTAAGAVILGSFAGLDEDELYVWIRRFNNEEHRAAFIRSYYETEEWVNVMRPRVRELIDPSRTVVTLLEATPSSLIQ